MNQQLENFYSHLNEAVITTNDFEEGTKFRKRSKVDQFAYCGLNPVYRKYLSFDLDEAGSAFRYEEVNLPAPTIITINPQNAHCHYLYELRTAVAYHENSRHKPQEYFEATQNAMTSCFKADTAFTHTLTKNPLNSRWQVITNPVKYDLVDFQEYIDLPSKWLTKSLCNTSMIRGRNDHLFHTLRLWGYRQVHSYINEQSWINEAINKALEINVNFLVPLPYKAVRDTAKGTAGWIWKHRHELRSRPKVMSFTDESAHERMSKGADYTNAIRKQKALDCLKNAVLKLTEKQIYPSPLLVQAESGLNIKTVRKYWSLL